MGKMKLDTSGCSIGIQVAGDLILVPHPTDGSDVTQSIGKIINSGTINSTLTVDEEKRECILEDEFPDYRKKSYEKYSKVKTLLYSTEGHNFYDFFVCNDLEQIGTLGREKETNSVITDVDLSTLFSKSHCSILVGMAGVGKSMMMRHLFLNAINVYERTTLLPVLIQLREYKGGDSGLFDLIVDSFSRFDSSISSEHIDRLLSLGRCQLIMDGLDEIRKEELNSFLLQLDRLSCKCVNTQIVISSRRFSSFIGLSRFKVYRIKEFSLKQALLLIDKFDYHSDEPELRERFKFKLKEDLFITHHEFATNPLLLTLMFLNFRVFTSIPAKLHLFYRQAYETLLQKHDGNKFLYSREYHSVNDPSEFTEVFSEFCARSYRRAYYEFDDGLFKKHFNELHCLTRKNNPKMTLENFRYDVLNSACIMYEEAKQLFFLHRSFQEFFFADYYSKQDDETLVRLGDYLSRQIRNDYDESHAFDMLYDFSPEKVEKLIFMPYLKEIFNDSKNALHSFWLFMALGFYNIHYTLIDEKVCKSFINEAENVKSLYNCHNHPFNIVMHKIYSLLGINSSFNCNFFDWTVDYEEFKSGVLVAKMPLEKQGDDTVINVLPLKLDFYNNTPGIKEQLKYTYGKEKENGALVQVGFLYTINLLSLVQDCCKYKPLVDYLINKESEFFEAYRRVSEYYSTLVERYEKKAHYDDDF